jgi:hypothetical protein
MKNFSSIMGLLALALGALATSSCEYTDSPYGHNGRTSYDEHPRYTHDPYNQERVYGRPDAYGHREGYDRDADRQTSIVLSVPTY